jgi:RNA-binding protein YhbY
MQATVQLGKNGITDGFIETLKNAFKKHDSVKVSLLKSATRDRKEAEETAKNLCKALGKHYTSNILGFTIFLKKWRKIPRLKK